MESLREELEHVKSELSNVKKDKVSYMLQYYIISSVADTLYSSKILWK